ncbi:oryzin precursor [Cordyceps fumosorosea ARSEF 2679]|uniref:Oryzin n=1 Tax=Cordyceps fumosorosea (strain ARSEF 2679) TaxID=1081104 RepID=A0A167R194_CORFA|nr:oryzin precursor [Cordyceps fumosorosea ARSEF 2679]OAA58175.1 oryzin precursor [Cordyceps fumosorosea ARSEF 2679]
MQLSLLLALLPFAAAVPTAKRSEPAPLVVPRGISQDKIVADEYIVKFKKGCSLATVEEAVKKLPNGTDRVFREVFKGFAGRLDAETLQLIRDHPDVEYVEQNTIAVAFAPVTQSPATWGLARLSSPTTGARGYVYDDSAGAGTCSYIIDSGVDASHPDFGGRAQQIRSFNGPNQDSTACSGHGTHVAGTIGSNTYGVAKRTSLFGVKILNYNPSTQLCQTPRDGVVTALDFVVQDSRNRNCPRGVVINMSLGGEGSSPATDDAIRNLVNGGIFVAVAAGNGRRDCPTCPVYPIDASRVTPASAEAACTVGATDSNDRIAYFSNYGPKVDIHAPGVDITSLAIGGGTRLMSGTSMASPHIAGLGAYFMGRGMRAQDVCAHLQSLAVRGAITGIHSTSRNLLAQNDQSQ